MQPYKKMEQGEINLYGCLFFIHTDNLIFRGRRNKFNENIKLL